MKNYKHILCTSDFSPYSDEAFSCALKLAKEMSAKLTLLHVVDYFPVDRSNEFIAPEDIDPKVYREEKAMEMLNEQIQRTHTTIDVEKMVTFNTGAADKEIIADAIAIGVDLIVIGSHGHKGWVDQFGSISKSVRKLASCDVTVIEPEMQAVG